MLHEQQQQEESAAAQQLMMLVRSAVSRQQRLLISQLDTISSSSGNSNSNSNDILSDMSTPSAMTESPLSTKPLRNILKPTTVGSVSSDSTFDSEAISASDDSNTTTSEGTQSLVLRPSMVTSFKSNKVTNNDAISNIIPTHTHLKIRDAVDGRDQWEQELQIKYGLSKIDVLVCLGSAGKHIFEDQFPEGRGKLYELSRKAWLKSKRVLQLMQEHPIECQEQTKESGVWRIKPSTPIDPQQRLRERIGYDGDVSEEVEEPADILIARSKKKRKFDPVSLFASPDENSSTKKRSAVKRQKIPTPDKHLKICCAIEECCKWEEELQTKHGLSKVDILVCFGSVCKYLFHDAFPKGRGRLNDLSHKGWRNSKRVLRLMQEYPDVCKGQMKRHRKMVTPAPSAIPSTISWRVHPEEECPMVVTPKQKRKASAEVPAHGVYV